jgi:hypothetical protein
MSKRRLESYCKTLTTRMFQQAHWSYLQAVMDNFSRKILAYRVSDKYEPTATATLLEVAANCMPPSTDNPNGPPPKVSVYCDGGVENFNDAVDQTLTRFQLQRIHAQIDVDFSNSLIEAFWCLAPQRVLLRKGLVWGRVQILYSKLQHFADHVPVNIGQPTVDAVVPDA